MYVFVAFFVMFLAYSLNDTSFFLLKVDVYGFDKDCHMRKSEKAFHLRERKAEILMLFSIYQISKFQY